MPKIIKSGVKLTSALSAKTLNVAENASLSRAPAAYTYESDMANSLRLWFRPTANNPKDATGNHSIWYAAATDANATAVSSPKLVGEFSKPSASILPYATYDSIGFNDDPSSLFTAADASAGDLSLCDASGRLQPFTIGFWVYHAASGNPTIASKGTPTASSNGYNYEWAIFIINGSPYSQVRMGLYTNSGGAVDAVRTFTGGKIYPNTWTYCVISTVPDNTYGTTYRPYIYTFSSEYWTTPTGNSTATSSGTWAAMPYDTGAPLKIGAGYNSTVSSVEIRLAEFAIWKKSILKNGQTGVIYNPDLIALVNGYTTGFFTPISGIINNPPRTILAARDNATGSYPTVSRIGDPGRTGRYTANFNDTSTVIFNDNVTVSYPMDLQSANATYISQSIATPNTNATIETTGIVRKGVGDANITFTPGEDLKPFVEDRLYASSKEAFTDPFYMTGSAITDVGLGFTSPLRSKTKIVIDLEPTTTTRFGELCEPGTDMSKKQSLMTYFNHVEKQWEVVGFRAPYFYQAPSTTPPAGYDTIADVNMQARMSGFGATSGRYALMMTRGWDATAAAPILGDDFMTAVGRPVTSFGFPASEKFHASSSQELNMSNYIDRPFVAEKFVLEYSASYGIANYPEQELGIHGASAPGAVPNCNGQMATFFILNQRSPAKYDITYQTDFAYGSSPSAVFPTFVTCSVPSSPFLSQSSHEPTYVDTSRDLVTWGQHLMYTLDGATMAAAVPGLTVARVLGALGRELNTDVGTNPPNRDQWLSGKFTMSGAMKSPNETIAIPGTRVNVGNSGAPYYSKTARWHNGGRTGMPLATSGRGLTAEVGGATLSGSFQEFIGVSTWLDIPGGSSTPRISPYVIMPTDRLVMGWQAPTSYQQYTFPSYDNEHYMDLAPGKGKLTIYGSLITDGHEHHDDLNQPLTSDAIHEFIGFHGPPLDQFDTEPRQQFSGSMISNVVTGSIFEQVQHGVVAQRSDGQWAFNALEDQSTFPKRPQSFNRSSVFGDENSQFYDCFMPDPTAIHKQDGLSLYLIEGVSVWIMMIGAPNYNVAAKNGGNPIPISNGDWVRAFPFEPRYSTLPRVSVGMSTPFSSYYKSSDFALVQSPPARDRTSIGYYDGANNGAATLYYASSPEGDTNIVYPPTDKNYNLIARYFFGTGRALGTPQYASGSIPLERDFIVGYTQHVAGFKYGVYHSEQLSPTCHFRNNKFGQFRDMMEQRPDTRCMQRYHGRSFVSYGPVWARFVSSDNTRVDPYKTSCSNMSNFSTSSLPYFDGVARNRGPIATADLSMTVVSI
jgi:hypothetical protein